MSNSSKVIFFDVGNTLLFPGRPQILAPLYQRDLVPSLKQWHAIECQTKSEFDAAMRQDGKSDHSFWYLFYSHLLDELQVHDDALRDALVEATRLSANWNEIRPGTRETLERMRKQYRLAIISNADGKIVDILTRTGIADCFLAITDSGLVGCEKPHSAIFETALRSMNAAASQSVYVGDMYSVDYVAATRAGMQAVLFDVCGAYRESGLPRVESLEELEQNIESLT